MRGRCWPPAEAAADRREIPPTLSSSGPGRPSHPRASATAGRPRLLVVAGSACGRRGRQSHPTSKGLAADRRFVGPCLSLDTRVKLTERDNLEYDDNIEKWVSVLSCSTIDASLSRSRHPADGAPQKGSNLRAGPMLRSRYRRPQTRLDRRNRIWSRALVVQARGVQVG
jgi:hypothetical protein